MKSFLPILFLFFACNQGPTTLTQKSQVQKRDFPDGRYNVAFLIMDGVYNTELTAPFDIFQHTIFRDSIKAMNTFLVAQSDDWIESFEGIKMLPDFSFGDPDMPAVDILVVPSAEHHLDTDLENKEMIAWVKNTSEKAMLVSSHCDGAFVLAKAGLLDGIASTTFPSDIAAYKTMFPQLDVKEGLIFVHDGKYVTSAGGARSFDAALYICEYLYGKAVAERLAKGLVIDWKLDEVKHHVGKPSLLETPSHRN